MQVRVAALTSFLSTAAVTATEVFEPKNIADRRRDENDNNNGIENEIGYDRGLFVSRHGEEGDGGGEHRFAAVTDVASKKVPGGSLRATPSSRDRLRASAVKSLLDYEGKEKEEEEESTVEDNSEYDLGVLSSLRSKKKNKEEEEEWSVEEEDLMDHLRVRHLKGSKSFYRGYGNYFGGNYIHRTYFQSYSKGTKSGYSYAPPTQPYVPARNYPFFHRNYAFGKGKASKSMKHSAKGGKSSKSRPTPRPTASTFASFQAPGNIAVDANTPRAQVVTTIETVSGIVLGAQDRRFLLDEIVEKAEEFRSRRGLQQQEVTSIAATVQDTACVCSEIPNGPNPCACYSFVVNGEAREPTAAQATLEQSIASGEFTTLSRQNGLPGAVAQTDSLPVAPTNAPIPVPIAVPTPAPTSAPIPASIPAPTFDPTSSSPPSTYPSQAAAATCQIGLDRNDLKPSNRYRFPTACPDDIECFAEVTDEGGIIGQNVDCTQCYYLNFVDTCSVSCDAFDSCFYVSVFQGSNLDCNAFGSCGFVSVSDYSNLDCNAYGSCNATTIYADNTSSVSCGKIGPGYNTGTCEFTDIQSPGFVNCEGYKSCYTSKLNVTSTVTCTSALSCSGSANGVFNIYPKSGYDALNVTCNCTGERCATNDYPYPACGDLDKNYTDATIIDVGENGQLTCGISVEYNETGCGYLFVLPSCNALRFNNISDIYQVYTKNSEGRSVSCYEELGETIVAV